MFRFIASALLPCAALLLSSPAAVAQTAARPDPASAAVSVPPLTYASPFARYRAYADQELAPWRETNDTVGRIGGWREYAREAAELSAEPAAEPAATVQRIPAIAAPATGGPDHMHKH